jgi:hypothetical protein
MDWEVEWEPKYPEKIWLIDTSSTINYDRRTVRESVLVSRSYFCFLFDNCRFIAVGRPLWREDGSTIYSYNCFWALPKQSLWGPSPAELRPYFTVSFETPPTWRARSQYLYPPETDRPQSNIWLRRYSTSRKVAGSSLDEVIEYF